MARALEIDLRAGRRLDEGKLVGVAADGFVENRVASGDVGAHQHQVAILLIGGPELAESRCGGGMVGIDRIDHRARQGPRNINRRIDALFSQSARRSEEHTSELQSLMRLSYAVFCLKKKKTH